MVSIYVSYPLQDKHLAACELDASANNWDKIFDFTDTSEAGEKTIHHSLLDTSQYRRVQKDIEGFTEEKVNPFPIPARYGGDAPDNDLSQHEGDGTFDIRTTSKEDAEMLYQQHQEKQMEQANDVLGNDQYEFSEETKKEPNLIEERKIEQNDVMEGENEATLETLDPDSWNNIPF